METPEHSCPTTIFIGTNKRIDDGQRAQKLVQEITVKCDSNNLGNELWNRSSRELPIIYGVTQLKYEADAKNKQDLPVASLRLANFLITIPLNEIRMGQ